MKEPVRILSDLHLGHAASRIDDVGCLRPLLRGVGTVVFNGDTWHEGLEGFCEPGERLLADLQALCDDEGVDALFLPGNHDPGWGAPGYVELAQGRILVTHGDGVFPSGSPWSREAFARKAQVSQLWQSHPGAAGDAHERLHLAREIARSLRAAKSPKGRAFLLRAIDAGLPPRRAWEILSVWFRHPAATAEFARHYFPRAEVVVAGHFHWPGCWSGGGPVVINTGAFVNPHPAWWVDWRDRWLRCGRVRERAPWHLGPAHRVWRFG